MIHALQVLPHRAPTLASNFVTSLKQILHGGRCIIIIIMRERQILSHLLFFFLIISQAEL